MRIATVFFAVILLSGTVTQAALGANPGQGNNEKNQSDHKTDPSTVKRNPKVEQFLESVPNTTPLQETLKKSFDIMKNGDPKKPKENNGKRNPEHIPDFTTELLSVKEIIKNDRLLGKEITTKSTIKFKNPQQIDPEQTEWDKIAFSRDWISEDSPETFEELCKKANGTIDEIGDVCDIENTVINTLNNKILNDAKGKKIKDKNDKELKVKQGKIFKSKQNPNGVDFHSLEQIHEITEKYTIKFEEKDLKMLEKKDKEKPKNKMPITLTSYDETTPNPTIIYDPIFNDISDLIIPQASAQDHTVTTEVDVLFGFTWAPPKYENSWSYAAKSCITYWVLIDLWTWNWEERQSCVEWFSFWVGYKFDAAAAFRLPVTLELVTPRSVLPGAPFSISGRIIPKDFTKQDYIDFCNNPNNSLKHAPTLVIASCERFALESSFSPNDGDEVAGRVIVGFGIKASVLNGSITLINFWWGPNMNFIDKCTSDRLDDVFKVDPQNPKSVITVFNHMKDKYGILGGDPESFAQFLKDEGLNCGSFRTPYGLDEDNNPINFPFGAVEVTIPAKCEKKNTPTAVHRVLAGNMSVEEYIIWSLQPHLPTVEKTKMCTNVWFEYGYPGILSFGGELGAGATLNISSNEIQSVFSNYGDSASGTQNVSFLARDGNGALTQPQTKTIGGIVAGEYDIETDSVIVKFDNFKYLLNSINYEIFVKPAITFTIGLKFPISWKIVVFSNSNTLPWSSVNLEQHPYTGPVAHAIPVDYFAGITIPPDKTFEATGPQTPLGLEHVGTPEVVNPPALSIKNDMFPSLLPPPSDWNVVASHSGDAAPRLTDDDPSDGFVKFEYDIRRDNFVDRSWTFTTVAQSDETLKLTYDYQGFHSWYQVKAGINQITPNGVTPLQSAGPVNCCSSPSGGFQYTGSVEFDVKAGQTYGFEVFGGNSDENNQMTGSLSVRIENPPTPPTEPTLFNLGQTILDWQIERDYGTSKKILNFQQRINIVDTTPPTITAQDDVFEATGPKTLIHKNSLSLSSVDIVDGDLELDPDFVEQLCEDGFTLQSDVCIGTPTAQQITENNIVSKVKLVCPANSTLINDIQTSGANKVAISDSHGRAEVFAIGRDGQVYHNFERSVLGEWNGWTNVGGTGATEIDIIKNSDGSNQVFIIGKNGGIWYKTQLGEGGVWTDWVNIPGFAKKISVAKNQDGRLEIFHLGSDDKIYHKWQQITGDNNTWTDWFSGGDVQGWGKDIKVIPNQDGRLEMFYIGTDNRIYHNYQNAPNSSWHGEQKLYPEWNTNVFAKKIDAIQNKDGRIEVFIIRDDNALWHNYQWGSTWGPSPAYGWSDFQPLEGTLSELDVSRNENGSLEVFAIGSDAGIHHKNQHGTPENSGPSGWQNWAKVIGGEGTHLEVANRYDRLFLVATQSNDQVYAISQLEPNSDWGPWFLLGNLNRANGIDTQYLVGHAYGGSWSLYDQTLPASKQFSAYQIPDYMKCEAQPIHDINSYTFDLGENQVVWESQDKSFNLSMASSTISIVDTTNPQFTSLPQDIDLPAYSFITQLDFGNAIAEDLVDDDVTVTNSNLGSVLNPVCPDGITPPDPACIESYTGMFRVGQNEVVWRAVDDSENITTLIQKVDLQFDDQDGDGISDSIDSEPASASSLFADADGTNGYIVSGDVPILVVDSEDSRAGIEISGDPKIPESGVSATFSVDDVLVDGETITLTVSPQIMPNQTPTIYLVDLVDDTFANTSLIPQSKTTTAETLEPKIVSAYVTGDNSIKIALSNHVDPESVDVQNFLVISSSDINLGVDTELWSAIGDSAVVTDGDFSDLSAQFEYNLERDGTIPDGDFDKRTWTFSTVAAESGIITLFYNWNGFHADSGVETGLDLINPDGSRTTLVNEGPVDCCVLPSGGFNYSGNVELDVQAGQTFGFELSGNNYDDDNRLLGTFSVSSPEPDTYYTIDDALVDGKIITLTVSPAIPQQQEPVVFFDVPIRDISGESTSQQSVVATADSLDPRIIFADILGDNTIRTLFSKPIDAQTVSTSDFEVSSPTKISVCDGLATIDVFPGDDMSVSCGSVTISAKAGTAKVAFHVNDSRVLRTEIPTQSTLNFDEIEGKFVTGEGFDDIQIFDNTNTLVAQLSPNEEIILDITPPVILLVGDNPQTINIGDSYTELGATATDNVDGDINPASITIDATAVNIAAVGSYSVTYDVDDAAGNSAIQVTRTVNVVDNVPPIITLVGDNPQTIEAGDSYTELGATATDNVDGDITASITTGSSSVDTATLGSYAVTYDVSDSSGNAAIHVTRTVNVVDTTAPTLTIPADITVEVQSPDFLTNGENDPSVTGQATATDIDPSPLVTHTDVEADDPDPQKLKVVTRTWAATDASGNQVLADQIITSDGAVVFFEVTATDLVDAGITPDCTAASGDTFPLGTTTVTCNANDSSSNISPDSFFDVIVQDTTPPTVTDPADITAEATAFLTPVDQVLTEQATADDIFGIASITHDAPADGFPLGDTLVHWTATDNNGNSFTTSTQLVTLDVINTISGKGQRSDVNDFLVYGVITDTTVKLDSGTQSFDLLLRYGQTILPETFSAELNGVDITSQFTPIQNSPDAVVLMLEEGRNTLILSIDGERSDGRTASEKDRLVFIVG
ncbi:immunoglobulin-like domain-containing protein [Candidatus Nitrosopumilus sediminis]|uniref:immunoglobulin-like domain-containing protein n=1 Tax=Candidatus Nitrosopumilus sediminis TaxID=1229909 RepID=UPI00138B0C89|nr:immunoglobulin-like domain-containing protein [Candidatus Nitrosopumilus sediminis]